MHPLPCGSMRNRTEELSLSDAAERTRLTSPTTPLLLESTSRLSRFLMEATSMVGGRGVCWVMFVTTAARAPGFSSSTVCLARLASPAGREVCYMFPLGVSLGWCGGAALSGKNRYPANVGWISPSGFLQPLLCGF